MSCATRAAGSEGCRTAVLDLQVPAMRQQENALAVLRTEFGRQKVSFDRFDIAYAVLWQRLHPNRRITSRDLPFLAESEVLTTILDDAAGVPLFGTAIGLLKLESLTAYSFVYPAGDSECRLHQLMAAALRERLSPQVVGDVHVLLRKLWDCRTLQDGTVADVRGFLEAVYHGVRAGSMPAEEILGYADQAVRYGGYGAKKRSSPPSPPTSATLPVCCTPVASPATKSTNSSMAQSSIRLPPAASPSRRMFLPTSCGCSPNSPPSRAMSSQPLLLTGRTVTTRPPSLGACPS
ncbi:MAG: hypothetical protein ACRDQH_08815 [Pseudonocardiaceae bacterium]